MRTFIATAIALIVGTGSALATADGPDYFDVKDVRPDDVLVLRRYPGPKSPRKGQVPHDAKRLENMACNGFKNGKVIEDSDGPAEPGVSRWCLVRYGSQEGWANARYLTESVQPQETVAAPASASLSGYPPAVAAAIKSNREMCKDFTTDKGFVRNDVDLNADGIKDWIVDYGNGHVECDGALSGFSGSGGSLLQVLVSTGPGNWALRYDGYAQDYKVVSKRGRTVLDLGLHGTDCKKVGAAPCSKVLDFNGKG